MHMEGPEVLKAMTIKDYVQSQPAQIKHELCGRAGHTPEYYGRFQTALIELRNGQEREEWAGHWYQKGTSKKTYYSAKMLDYCMRKLKDKHGY